MPDRVARHHVREEIQRRILSGETQPGERLSQQSLARELGVAQGTVRESLFELQWLGLVESIDRLSRLPQADWQKLKSAIDSKGLLIVALDLPTSHQAMRGTAGDEFTGRMLAAINAMLVDMMAAIARKDYEQRRERQAQGIEKAKAEGRYQGRPIDEDLHKRVKELLSAGLGVRATARHAQCSTTTVLKIRDQTTA